MSKKSVEIERVMANVQASMAVEGMKPSRKAQTIGRNYMEGKISSDEAVAQILARHAAKFGRK